MGLFLRRALAVCLLFAVLSLTAPVSKVHGQASVEITDLQSPAQVAQGSEATISFTVSWTGAPERSHLVIVLAEKGYVKGRVEQPSSCIASEGYAACEILSPTYSGREYVKFVLDPQPLGKHQFGLVALLNDADNNDLADSGGGNNFFAIEWTSASTTKTSLAATLSTYSVTIDGRWTNENEWSDSADVVLSSSDRICHFRIKHDASSVYLLWDFVADQKIESGMGDAGDRVYVGFDVDHDGVVRPNVGPDFFVYLYWWTGQNFEVVQGKGVWGDEVTRRGIEAASSIASSPLSPIPHVIYEMKIDKESYQIGNNTVGIRVAAWDAGHPSTLVNQYPANSVDDDAATWADLSFATATTTTARTTVETTPAMTEEPKTAAGQGTVSTTQWLTGNWIAIVFGAIVVAALIGLLLAVRMRARASPPAPTQRSTTPAETIVAKPSAEVAEPRVRAAGPTKFCRRCGAKIPRDSAYCEECGTQLSSS